MVNNVEYGKNSHEEFICDRQRGLATILCTKSAVHKNNLSEISLLNKIVVVQYSHINGSAETNGFWFKEKGNNKKLIQVNFQKTIHVNIWDYIKTSKRNLEVSHDISLTSCEVTNRITVQGINLMDELKNLLNIIKAEL